MKNNRLNKTIILLLILVLTLGMLSGCKKKPKEDPNPQSQNLETVEETSPEEESEDETPEEKPEEEPEEAEAAAESENIPDENGYYYEKDEVALYIHTYRHLPDNFMTKKEAKKLGWSGGSLEKFAPGKVIGGDNFGNFEGVLPDDNNQKYYECDIDTYKKKKRGAKRIVWSEDGYIYYTEDHYETYEVLYEGWD